MIQVMRSLVFGILIIGGLLSHEECWATEIEASGPALNDTVDLLQRLYATDVILGTPQEIEGVTIIPLATVGMGYGRRQGTQGMGGVLRPVGVLVVSSRGVELLPLPIGTVEQILGTLTPAVLRMLRHQEAAQPGKALVSSPPLTIPEVLGMVYALLPQGGWRFGFFPWPLPLVGLFLIGWLVCALLVSTFFPQRILATSTTLQNQPVFSGLIGLLAYGMTALLAVILAVSIIGLPLTALVLALTWVLHVLGLISVARLVGYGMAVALHRPRRSEVMYMVFGGILLGLVRLIPFVGWSVWLVLSLGGLGALLLTQFRQVRLAMPETTTDSL